MILGIMGSRTILDKDFVYKYLDQFSRINKDITEVVSGRAIGPDSLGENWAKERGYKFTPFPPLEEDIKRYSYAKACYMRNVQMAEYCDRAVLFWDGKSSGTSNMMSELKKHNKSYEMCLFTIKSDSFLKEKE